jgi:hypothetical protein
MSRIVIVTLLYHRHKPINLIRLSEEPSFATTVQSVYFYLHFDRYMFRPSLAIFRRSIQYFKKLSFTQKL